jgi:hypothetical protein
VRSLAQRSSEAAREIKSLIDQSAGQVSAGMHTAHAARDSIDQTVKVVRDVGSLAEKISFSVSEQLAAISSINGAVEELDAVTRQNATMVEELSCTSATLRRQSDAVVDATRLFRLAADDTLHVSRRDAVALRKQAKAAGGGAAGAGFSAHAYIQAHADWKVKFRAAIESRSHLDEASIRRDDCCELGRWLHGAQAARWSHSPRFKRLIARHADFHVEAAEVAKAINRTDYAGAQARLEEGSVYAQCSSDVIGAIGALARVLDGTDDETSAARSGRLGASAGVELFGESRARLADTADA